MTDPTPLEPTIRPAGRGLSSRISVIWLVPVLALVVSLGIAWQSFSERGVLIEIAFENASGIVAEKTELKFRDVHVGIVTDVRFTDDLSRVVAAVRVDRSVAPFLDADARFWVVRPEVSVRGISGLNTVLSGVYIEGTWDSSAGVALTSFEGLEKAPLAGANRGGTSIALRARDGNSIAAGAPILYKGIPVGVIEAPLLAEDGDGVVINAFIEAPYDRFLTTNTRFWDISGVSVSLGPGGVALNFSSLASLVEGGISFDTLIRGGDPLQPGATFQLYASEADARDSLLVDTTTERLTVSCRIRGDGSRP
jgi:paraquat-inducible protein B